MSSTRSEWKQLSLFFGLFLLFYVTSFVALVLRGDDPGWNSPPRIGFRYSRNDRLDAALYYFYLPLYTAAQPLVPLDKLHRPFGMTPAEEAQYDMGQ